MGSAHPATPPEGPGEPGGALPPLTRVLLPLQVQLDSLPGMSLMAGKALSSARMSDAVLSQSSLMGSQQLRARDSEGEGLQGTRGLGRG